MTIKAWTGGSLPRPLAVLSREERALVSKLFREQMTNAIHYWRELPIMDTVRIFWRRARHDAHATFRPEHK